MHSSFFFSSAPGKTRKNPTGKSATLGRLSFRDVSRSKTYNSKLRINKLPSELLARIFVLGDEEKRAARNQGWPYRGLQDLAVRVCTHWRKVALGNPTLWTYIYISCPGALECATWYIMRSGNSSLLDIDLDIGKNFFDQDPLELGDHWVHKLSSVGNAIDFLIHQGAPVHRWKSLTVRSRIPQVLYKVLEYIRPESATSLRFLSLEWKTRPAHSQFRLESQTLDYLFDYKQHRYSPGDRLPQLHTAHFNALPIGYLLDRPLPILTGLAHLKLTPAFSLCSHAKLHTILSANPQLESLDINSDSAVGSGNFESTDLRVALPNLKSLALAVRKGSLSWVLGIMNMIDSPGVEHLEISSPGLEAEAISKLATQIVISRPLDDENEPTLLYPSLQSLDISGIRTLNDCSKAFRKLFTALHTVTSLTAQGSALEKFDVFPCPLLHLERIKILGEVPPKIGAILCEREVYGFPVKTLEVRKGSLGPNMGGWPKSLAVVEVPVRCVVFLGEDESSDEDDDLGDTDDI
ncbi:hypothetical protein FRC08_016008 [Ceratobasidium sp. 394]|nr:hypothetical protein FRC08_016008 [Ceratobasidium sp. 394]